MEEYYRILGIKNNATTDEIKKAYREKAKLYHPDVNPSPKAKEMFVEIQKAYDILLSPQAIPKTINPYSEYSNSVSKKKTYKKSYKEGMSYEDFKSSEHYEKARLKYKKQIFTEAATYLFAPLFLSVVAGIFMGLYTSFGIFILLNLLLSIQWFHLIKPLRHFSKKDFNDCIQEFKHVHWYRYIILPILLLFLLRLLSVTFIHIYEIMLMGTVLFLITGLVLYNWKNKWEWKLSAKLIMPFIILILLLNYIFAVNTKLILILKNQTTYSIGYKKESFDPSDYPFFVFLSQFHMDKQYNTLYLYSVSDGLFGFKILESRTTTLKIPSSL